MKTEINLLSYLPLFVQEYDEIQRIMNTEKPEFELLWDMNEDIRKQLFIVTATDQGLQRFEKLLGIFPSSEDTIQSRRARILTLWNDITPYTFNTFIAMLKGICGDDFTVIPNFNEYALEIITHIGFFGGVRDLEHIIENIIPVNLVVTSINQLDVKPTKELYIGVTTMNILKYVITGDFNTTYSMNGSVFNGSTLIQSKVEFVTNDFNANFNMSGEVFKGATAINANKYTVTNDYNANFNMDGEIFMGSSAYNSNGYTVTNDFNGEVKNETPLNSINTITVVTKHQIN